MGKEERGQGCYYEGMRGTDSGNNVGGEEGRGEEGRKATNVHSFKYSYI